MALPNAEAGPSRLPVSARVESMSPPSPLNAVDEAEEKANAAITKNGLSVDENGEVSKLPAFLTKLYNMVSDPKADEHIYWSDSGDSFFVPNQEQFAKQILPRYFKHSNFSSFVRQLNMYAFHKVPHLNSSVLSNEAPQELWEFVNPLFKRGQPELLARIVRKQRPTNAPMPAATPTGTRSRPGPPASNLVESLGSGPGSSQFLITDGTTTGEASGVLVGPQGQQMLDISTLTSHIADMKRTQGTIAADLKALKASQEHLWREQLEQRETQKKHQDTIDLIVSFLERLFGTDGEGLKTLKEAMRRSGMGRAREDSSGEEGATKKRRRLGLDRMIGDGREGSSETDLGKLVEISSEPSSKRTDFSMPRLSRGLSSRQGTADPPSISDWSSASNRFTTLPSEGEPSPAGVTPRTTVSGNNPTLSASHLSPLSDTDPQPTNGNAIAPYMYPSNPALQQPPLSPTSAVNAAAAYNLDPSILQTTIGSLLQSPAAAQMFLNSLNNSVQGQALQSPRPSNADQQPQFPLHPQANGVDIDPTLALFTPLPNQDTLVEQNDALLKSYQDAAAMGTDVEKLQNDIDSLVRSMGLDVSNGADTDHFLANLNSNGTNTQNAYNGVPNLNFNNANNFNNMQDYGGFAGSTNPTNSAVTTGAAGLSTPSGFPSSTTGFNTGTAGTGSHDDSSGLTDGLPDEFDVDEFLNSLQKGVSEDGAVEGL